MLTAILADDEPMILRGLEKLIDWQQLGVTIIGTVGDGQEALKLIEEYDPDIVISDINMPGFSGIDLLKQLKKEVRNTKLIFISGYQEFEYARDALKYGAVDYLIKPINEKQLVMAIQKIVEEKKMKTRQPYTLELHLDEISDSQGLEKEIAGTRKHLSNNEGCFYGVLCCLLDCDDTISVDEQEIIQFSMYNTIEELTKDIEGHWIIDKDDRIYLLIYGKNISEVEGLITSLSRDIIDTFYDETCHYISISTSEIVDEINVIQAAFKTANERIKQCYFYERGSVINYNCQHKLKYTLEDHYKAQTAILDSINTYDSRKIGLAVQYYMDIVKDVSLWDKRSAINYCLATLVFIQQHLSDDALNLRKRDFEAIKVSFKTTSNYSQMVELMSKTCEQYLQEIVAVVNDQQNGDIKKVKEYIQEHYAEHIKLETLADMVYMNQNYFSGYFKKHVGMKFKEYITNFRINEAEKLMLSSNYKVYEIAEAVGFGDYRHFSLVFKKIKGLSPSEYKKKIMNA